MRRHLRVLWPVLAVAAFSAAGPASADAQISLPSADLSIVKTDSPDPVGVGGNITYSVTVSNAGPDAAVGAHWDDSLPASLDFVSLQQDSGPTASCTPPPVGSSVSCSWGSLDAGSAATFTLVAHVSTTTPPGTVVSNTATIDALGSDDPDPSHNSGTATTTVNASADLSTSVTDSPDPVVAGETVTYHVSLHNAGPSDAADARVTLPLPAGTTFESAAPGCTHDATAITCAPASLAAGSDAAFDLVVRTDAAAQDGSLTAKPRASATTADPDGSNDESTATTAVSKKPVVQQQPTTDPPPPPPPPPLPPAAPQKIALGNAVEGANSGVIFIPVTCTNDALGFCTTTVTITFRKPHQKLKPIKRKLRITSGQMSVAFMSASLAQREKIRVIRRLKVTVTATNAPGPVVKRNSTLSGHPRARR